MEDHLRQLNALAEFLVADALVVEAEEADYRANRRRWYVRPVNQDRNEQGAVNHLVQKMRAEDDESFFNLTIGRFDHLLEMVELRLQKYSMRESLSPETRLLITLGFFFFYFNNDYPIYY